MLKKIKYRSAQIVRYCNLNLVEQQNPNKIECPSQMMMMMMMVATNGKLSPLPKFSQIDREGILNIITNHKKSLKKSYITMNRTEVE